MKKILLIISLISYVSSFAQKSEIEGLINQIANDEIPENFEYYFLVSKGLKQVKTQDSIENYKIRELKMLNKDFPLELFYRNNKETINWADYNLKKTKLVFSNHKNLGVSFPNYKNIFFVKYNIEKIKYDSIIRNRKPHTIVVKKKWFWNKNKYWKNKKLHKELIKAWELDEKINIEEKVYLKISKPIFSKNNNYAKISIIKDRRCNGNGFTAIYQKEKRGWRKIFQYNEIELIKSFTHSKCKEIKIFN